MKATQSPMPMASIKSQCPVRTHTQTMETESEKETISATVKRPQTPNEILRR